MSIYNDIAFKVDNICDKFAEIVKDAKRHAANEKLDKEIALKNNILLFTGHLKNCNQLLAQDMKRQARLINEGRQNGFTIPKEEALLRETITSYLMIREAIYHLSTVNVLNDIGHAFGILDSATKQLSKLDSSIKLPKAGKLRKAARSKADEYETLQAVTERHTSNAEMIFNSVLQGMPIEEAIKLHMNKRTPVSFGTNSEKDYSSIIDEAIAMQDGDSLMSNYKDSF